MIRAKFCRAHIRLWVIVLPVVIAITSGCGESWQDKLTADLGVMGHRNWIVVADSAYPAQNKPGIETIVTGRGQVETVKAVLDAVDAAEHVQPVIYLDSELESVSQADAPGITDYRSELDALLAGRNASSIPHEELIAKLDDAAKMFRILILKTYMTLPYTSVFVQLDCGYWNADAEKRLRDRISRGE
jgi:L-fucose mutarotase/ribose pyranase (RbsD/FucU family)